MILYNITALVETGIQQEWLTWVKRDFIPAVEQTGLFSSVRLLQVLNSPNEGFTYCVQSVTEKQELYQQFKQEHEPSLLAAAASLFGNKFVYFDSQMEFII